MVEGGGVRAPCTTSESASGKGLDAVWSSLTWKSVDTLSWLLWSVCHDLSWWSKFSQAAIVNMSFEKWVGMGTRTFSYCISMYFLFPDMKNVRNYLVKRYKFSELYILIFLSVSMSSSRKSGDCKWVSLKTWSANISDFFILNNVEKNVINLSKKKIFFQDVSRSSASQNLS